MRLGWWLSSEEHDPRELVRQAVEAEAIGVATTMVSDHLQPWTRAQGHASHVWTVIGAIAQATETIEIGTGVVALVQRHHPIEVAQASATAAVMSEERFFLGVGLGERLNEQPFGQRWPRAGDRRRRLREAVDLMRRLWAGEHVNHRGQSWTVERLALMDRPLRPPPVYVAGGGHRGAKVAGEIGDGLIAIAPDGQLVERFNGAGGTGKPCVAQLHVSLAATEAAAVENAFAWWPNAVVPAHLNAELDQPRDFESIAEAVGPRPIADTVVCACDAGAVVGAIDRFAGAGFDTVYLHQVGPDQQRLRDLIAHELAPHYARPCRSTASSA
jgi:coenzyme F420-dependent glucose-6-phosphate dehydrogenase